MANRVENPAVLAANAAGQNPPILVAQADTPPQQGADQAAAPATVTIEIEAGSVLRLPEGASIDAPRLNGSVLEFVQPDGSVIAVPNGAVDGLTIMLGAVEIPAIAVAALFEQNNIQAAAGPEGAEGSSYRSPDRYFSPTDTDEEASEPGDLLSNSQFLAPGGAAGQSTYLTNFAPLFGGGTLLAGRIFETGIVDSSSVFTVDLLASDPESGPLEFTFGAPPAGLASGGVALTWLGEDTSEMRGSVNGVDVIRASIVGGQLTVTLLQPLDHAGSGADSLVFAFTVIASDGQTSTSAIVQITAVDDVPAAQDWERTFDEDNDIEGQLAGAAGADGFHATAYTLNSLPGHGTLVIDEQTGRYTYSPDRDFFGEDSFTYVIKDADGDVSEPITVTLTINPVNDAPVASDDAGTALEAGGVQNGTAGQNATGNVLLNDSDVDDANATLKVYAVRTGAEADTGTLGTVGTALVGAYGSLTLNADGTYSYVVDNTNATVQALRLPSQTLTESFTYTVTDPSGARDTATLTITITGANDAPVAVGDTGWVQESGIGSGNMPILGSPITIGNVLGNDMDVDFGDAIKVTEVSAGQTEREVGFLTSVKGVYGTLVLSSTGGWIYTLDNTDADTRALAHGERVDDVFVYTIEDKAGATAQSTLTIEVTGSNDIPVVRVAQSDLSASGTEDTETLSGTMVFRDDDANDLHSVSHSVTTSVSRGVDRSLLANAADWFEVNVTEESAGVGADGEISWSFEAGQSLQFLAAGERVTLTYMVTVRDELGANVKAPVVITITGTNDAPQINAVAAVALTEPVAPATLSKPITVTFTDVDLNDVGHSARVTDVEVSGRKTGLMLDEDALIDLLDVESITKLAGSANGTLGLQFDAPAGTFDYLRAGQTVTLKYTVEIDDGDGDGGKATTQVSITITGTNDAPVADNDTSSVSSAGFGANDQPTLGQPLASGNVLSNDTDLDHGDTKAVSSIALGSNSTNIGAILPAVIQGTYGSLTMFRSGAWVYTLNNFDADTRALGEGDVGTEVFTYIMRDGSGATSTATLTITVAGANDLAFILIDGAVSNDRNVVEAGHEVAGDASASGKLVVLDVDTGENVFQAPNAGDLDGNYGTFTFNHQTGEWTYSLDNARGATQGLSKGAVAYENLTVLSEDGTASHTIRVTVSGTNDVPVITSTAQVGSVIEDVSAPLLAPTVALADYSAYNLDAILGKAGAEPDFTFSYSNMATVLGQLQTAGLDKAEAFAAVWQYLDRIYVSANYYAHQDLNAAGVRLGVEYARYLQAGGAPLTDLIAKFDADDNDNGIPQRLQSLHDNLLGNLHFGTINGRFAAGLKAELFALIDTLGIDLSDRSVFDGREGKPNLAAPFDVANGLLPGATGQVTADDVDSDSILTFSGNLTSEYGSFAIDPTTGQWSFFLNHAAAQKLGAGQGVDQVYTVTVTDQHGASDTTTVTITIHGTNDAPVLSVTNAGVSYVEPDGTNINFLTARLFAGSDITLTDADSDASFASITLTASHITDRLYIRTGDQTELGLSLSKAGTAYTISQDSSHTLTITKASGGNFSAAEIEAIIKRVIFHSGEQTAQSESHTVSITTIDNHGAASNTLFMNVAVTGTNDTPTWKQSALTAETIEDVGFYLNDKFHDFDITPEDRDNGTDLARVYFNVTGGTVELTPMAGIAIGTLNGVQYIEGNLDAIDNFLINAANNGSNVFFKPTLNFHGEATISLVVDDLGDQGLPAKTATSTITITVNPVNDAPVLSNVGNMAIDEDNTIYFRQHNIWTASDPDQAGGKVEKISLTLRVVEGEGSLSAIRDGLSGAFEIEVSDNGKTLVITTLADQGGGIRDAIQILNSLLRGDNFSAQNKNGIAFKPNADWNGDVRVTYELNDHGNLGTGGALSASGEFNITVNPVNDAPVAKDFNSQLTIAENTVQTGLNFGQMPSELVSDVDTLMSHFTAARFAIAGVSIAGGAEISAALAGITVDANGNIKIDTNVAAYNYLKQGDLASVVVRFIVTDDGDLSDEGTVTFKVSGINDAVFTVGADTIDLRTILDEHRIQDGNYFDAKSGDDTIYLPDAANFLGTTYQAHFNGGGVFSAGEGNDTVYGGDLNDKIDGGDGDDTLEGGAGDDGLYGGVGNDVLRGGGGNDTLHGGAGADRLSGDEGTNTLVGGADNDQFFATYGNNTIWGNEEDASVASNVHAVAGESDNVVYYGTPSDFQISLNSDGSWTVNNTANGTTDTLRGIEGIDFNGGGVDLDLTRPIQVFNASNHLVGTYTTIQAAIDAADPAYTVRVTEGTYNEQLTVREGITIQGVGDVTVNGGTGITLTIGGGGAGQNLAIKGIDFVGGGTRVVTVEKTAVFDKVSLTDGEIRGGQYYGMHVNQSAGVQAFLLDGVTFAGNATTHTGSGETALYFWLYNGNITLHDVVIKEPGANAEYAIQIRGIDNYADMGTVVLDGVTVAGAYAKNAVAIYHYDGVDGLDIIGLNLAATTSILNWHAFNMDGILGSYDASEFGLVLTASQATNLQGDKANQVASDQTIIGTDNGDIIRGGGGVDTLYGGGVNDIISGEDGDDVIYGGSGHDTIHGGAGNDRLFGDANVDTIYGGDGDDYISGGSGGDILHGDAGDDVIHGDNGNDTLYGGAGDDSLYGGNGSDTYVHGSGLGEDFVSDTGGNVGDVDVIAAASGGAMLFSGISGIERIDGGSHANVSVGGTLGADVFDLSNTEFLNIAVVDTSGGDDTIYTSNVAGQTVGYRGSYGNDTFVLGSQDATLLYGGRFEGADKVLSTGAGRATLKSTTNGDVEFEINTHGGSGYHNVKEIDGTGAANARVIGVQGAADEVFDLKNVNFINVDEVDAGDSDDTIYTSELDGPTNGYRGSYGDDTFHVGTKDATLLYGGRFQGTDTIHSEGGSVVLKADGSGTVEISVNTKLGDGYAAVAKIDGSASSDAQVLGTNDDEIIDLRKVELVNIAKVDAGGGNDRVYVSTVSSGPQRYDGSYGNDTLIISLTLEQAQNTTLLQHIRSNLSPSGNGTVVMDGIEFTSVNFENYVFSIDVGGQTLLIEGTNLLFGTNNYDNDINAPALVVPSVNDANWGLYGLSGNDVLSGGAGNDLIVGGAGRDTMSGGAGDDTFLISGSSSETIDGGQGYDRILFTASDSTLTVSSTSIQNVEEVDANGFANVKLEGTIGRDELDFRNVVLKGLEEIDGGRDVDTIHTSNLSAARYRGGSEGDIFHLGSKDATLLYSGANNGSDTFYGNSVDAWHTIQGQDSHTVIGLTAGFSNGVDEIIGNGGKILGDNSSGVLDFSDVKITGVSEIDGGGGNDIITGSSGADRISGGSGSDILTGGEGDDILWGGIGKDTLTGDAGRDTFVFKEAGAANADIITDYVFDQDTVDLSALLEGVAGDKAEAVRVDAATNTISVNTGSDWQLVATLSPFGGTQQVSIILEDGTDAVDFNI